jgi:hypothetical protein
MIAYYLVDLGGHFGENGYLNLRTEEFSSLKMEAACVSETSVHFYYTTRRHVQEDNNYHNHWRENIKYIQKHSVASKDTK